jgi:hypothetical protein
MVPSSLRINTCTVLMRMVRFKSLKRKYDRDWQLFIVFGSKAEAVLYQMLIFQFFLLYSIYAIQYNTI